MTFTARIDPELYGRLVLEANDNNWSVNAMLNQVLRERFGAVPRDPYQDTIDKLGGNI